MHPVARVFHYVFLVAGLVLLLGGYSTQSDSTGSHAVNLGWVCHVTGTGAAAQQDCTTNNGNYATATDENTGITISLAGVGLIVASVAVAMSGRRKDAAAPVATPAPTAPTGSGGYSSSYAPQPSAQPFQAGQPQPLQTPPSPPPAPPAQGPGHGQGPGQPGGYR